MTQRGGHASPPVSDQNWDGHSAGRCHRLMMLQILLDVFLVPGPFGLVAVILEPDLDLRRGQVDEVGQMLPFGGRQVALLAESTLQFVSLSFGEEDASLAFLITQALLLPMLLLLMLMVVVVAIGRVVGSAQVGAGQLLSPQQGLSLMVVVVVVVVDVVVVGVTFAESVVLHAGVFAQIVAAAVTSIENVQITVVLHEAGVVAVGAVRAGVVLAQMQ